MVTLAEWIRRKFVALVYVGSNPTRHPFFETIVYIKTFNPRMIGWQNAVAVKPQLVFNNSAQGSHLE